MSEISLTVRDAERAIHTRIHASRVDYLVAALSADPETIAEHEAALARYLPEQAPGFFGRWQPGVDADPWDAGVCVIDLAARLIVLESSYSRPGLSGEVRVTGRDGRDATVRYHLADDWLVVDEVEGWERLARDRRAARPTPFDPRPVLYDRVCDFVASAGAAEGPGDEAAARDRIAATHARWLTTPRDDLRGRAPRDVLLERRGHVDWDLQDRCERWGMLSAAPPGLGRDSAAYRLAGFGTHEIVLYYELVRELLHDCWDRRGSLSSPAAAAAEADRLRRVRDDWLESPDVEDLGGRTPASVIERERLRLPEAMTGADAVVDHDCPICQAMADHISPVFWHLDGCNMDDDFAFSFHRTREEWEAGRRKSEEFNRSFNARWEAERRREKLWTGSYVNPDLMTESPEVVVIGLTFNLAELIQDVKAAGGGRDVIDDLNRRFGNLREVVAGAAGALAGPVTERFCESLTALAADHPPLTEKCADLERRSRELADQLAETTFK